MTAACCLGPPQTPRTRQGGRSSTRREGQATNERHLHNYPTQPGKTTAFGVLYAPFTCPFPHTGVRRVAATYAAPPPAHHPSLRSTGPHQSPRALRAGPGRRSRPTTRPRPRRPPLGQPLSGRPRDDGRSARAARRPAPGRPRQASSGGSPPRRAPAVRPRRRRVRGAPPRSSTNGTWRSSDSRTSPPTKACAWRNGMPWSTSSSARSMAAAAGPSAAACIRSWFHVAVRRRRASAARARPHLAHRVEQRLLVLLQVAVVGERQALEGDQHRRSGARSAGPSCPGPARRRRGSSSAAASSCRWRRRRRAGRSRTPRSTTARSPRPCARGARPAARGRTAPRRRSRGRTPRRASSRSGREPELGRHVVGVERQGRAGERARPQRRHVERSTVVTRRSTSRASAQPCASR